MNMCDTAVVIFKPSERPHRNTHSTEIPGWKLALGAQWCHKNALGLSFLFIFQLRTAAFKAYCAILVRRTNFRHQASPRVSPRQSTQQWKVELWARNFREFCLNPDLHVTFRDLLHAVKLRHGTYGFTSPPKEGVLKILFALKIRRLRPGLNPRTWVPKANTLPLDHLENNRVIDIIL